MLRGRGGNDTGWIVARPSDPILSLAVRGSRAYFGMTNGALLCADIVTGTALMAFSNHASTVRAIALLGDYVFTGCLAGALRCFSPTDPCVRARLTVPVRTVTALNRIMALEPYVESGQARVAVACHDGRVLLVSVEYAGSECTACPSCGVMVAATGLAAHLHTHPRPFNCHHASCQARFSSRASLREHLQNVHDVFEVCLCVYMCVAGRMGGGGARRRHGLIVSIVCSCLRRRRAYGTPKHGNSVG